VRSFSCLALKYEAQKFLVLDQTRLPQEEIWLECQSPEEMRDLILRLAVRGAPLIGVAAALSLALYGEKNKSGVKEKAVLLRAARPTAVNLMWAMDRMLTTDLSPMALTDCAEKILAEEIESCEGMAKFGAALIADGDQILTHCNTGGLATPGIGTAFGVIRRAHEEGKKIHVWVDETRPLLQGARLTAWELEKLKIPHTLICDNMAASLMQAGKVQKIFVGADRIAVNGDFANKIGTYSVAVLAHFHKIPFYPVAPVSTLDLACAFGREIPIEMRSAEEVRRDWSPKTVPTWNPAFDVTPVELVSGLVLNTAFYSHAKLREGVLKLLAPRTIL
jgi:methylthioribose-1-phosphate isomerase